jgi:RimJ/RimL family protein N-acetyltransferase
MTPHLADTPVLKTDRLILRAPRMADYSAFEAFYASDRAQYIGGPGPARDAWRGFAHVTGMWALKGFGTFVFADPATDEAIGMTGPYYPEDWPEPELGWHVWRPEHEGTGLTYEAAKAARAYAYDTLQWTTAVSYIDQGNNRSVRLAKRLGCVLDETATPLDHADPPVLIYRHPAPEALR